MIMHTSRLQRPSPQVVISIILVKKKKKKKLDKMWFLSTGSQKMCKAGM